MRLAARKGVGRTVEGEVIQPDVGEELQATGDFLDDTFRDGLLLTGERQALEKLQCLFQGQMADFINRVVSNRDMTGLLAQSRALAAGAGLMVEVLASSSRTVRESVSW